MKREIVLRSFPENLKPLLYGTMESYKIADLNKIHKLFQQNLEPGCWITNFSYRTKKPHSGCFKTELSKYPDWEKDGLALVSQPKLWDQAIKTLHLKLPSE